MKKVVNGIVVDVNMELFELAAEGLAIQKTTTSITSDGLDNNVNSALIKKYLKQYDMFFKSMPYPLYAVERDIKYITLGNFIKSLSKNDINMWVNHGLHIKLDTETGMTLTFVNNTWSIDYIKEHIDTDIEIEKYEGCTGYKEYLWVLNKVLHKEKTTDFYKEMMPEFVVACRNQPMILKWELENILTFAMVDDKRDLKSNKVLDIENNLEYTIDPYYTGTIDTGEKIQVWSLSGDNVAVSSRAKGIKGYDYEVYCKNIDNSNKLEKSDLKGLRNLFMELCGIKGACEMEEFPEFKGIIEGINFAFTIEGRLFVSKSNKLYKTKDIANSAEIYNMEKGTVYFTKSKKINDKVTKETLYSYKISTEAVRVCKIQYKY